MVKDGFKKHPVFVAVTFAAIFALVYIIIIYKKMKTITGVKTATTNQDVDKTKGQRNNNPLNLRNTSTQLPGQIKSDSSGFNVFSTIEYGYRAAIKQLWRYYSLKKLTSVKAIVSKWAPANVDNNSTANYIKFVSDDMGVTPEQTLQYDRETISKLLSAMSQYESGLRPTQEQLEKAWSLSEDGKQL